MEYSLFKHGEVEVLLWRKWKNCVVVPCPWYIGIRCIQFYYMTPNFLGVNATRELKWERLTQVIRSVAKGFWGNRWDQQMKIVIEAEGALDCTPQLWPTSCSQVWLNCCSYQLPVIFEFCFPLPHYCMSLCSFFVLFFHLPLLLLAIVLLLVLLA